MINYPEDEKLRETADIHGVPLPVLIRDIVRIVEVLNLKDQSFFSRESVLSGSMALRCFNSPRFTVYDVDFSTENHDPATSTSFSDLLSYSDDELEITPAASLPHDEQGTAWKVEPVDFDPVFTDIDLDRDDRRFKVDISHRGLVCPGIEMPLRLPYDLGLWVDDPAVWIMDPHEVVAEKTLGWCVRKLAKHYADLAFISVMANPAAAAPSITMDSDTLRSVLESKLERMKQLQPRTYTPFVSIDMLIETLDQRPVFDGRDWNKLIYLKQHRSQFKPEFLERAVRTILVPLFRR